MSRVYDNWERLVAAVLRREELWQLCHEDSRDSSINSASSEFSSSWNSPPLSQDLTYRNSEVVSSDATRILALWEKQYKRGVYVTLTALSDGTRFVKRVRFSRMGFEEQHQAVIWWLKNRERIYKKYNAWGGNAQIRRPSVVTFSWSPLIDHHQEFLEPTPSHAAIVNPLDHSVDTKNVEQKGDIVIVSDQDENEEKGSLLAESDDEHGPVKSEASRNTGNGETRKKASLLSEDEKIYLHELKQLVREGLNRHEFSPSSLEDETKSLPREDVKETTQAPQEVFIWGVKLMEDERSDVILLKFLRTQDYEVNEAFTMIKNTVKWRKEFGIDKLVEEDLGITELDRVVFMHGYSKEGHPVCYSVFGEFQNKELYEKMFSDEEKRQRFLRWRIQFFEKSIRNLDFNPGGISTIFHVHDLKNSPGPNRLELRQASNQSLQLLQDNYPKFVAKQVFINAPRWYIAFTKIISPFLTQRTKSMVDFARPSSSMATLFKYISAEQIPPQYRGLSLQDGVVGAADHSVTEIVVKPPPMHIEEFPVTQAGVVSWEVREVGWELSYGVEFVENGEYGYTIIIEKMRRIGSTQEQLISGSYQVSVPGKLILTISNLSS